MNYSAKLIGLTQPINIEANGPEALIAYCARRSSGKPRETWGDDYEGLLNYCIKNKHWSVFAMADAVVEIEAPRDICRQILRHKSGEFQEFSQRYSDDIAFTTRDIRRQDSKNRQSSHDDFTDNEKEQFKLDCQQAVLMMKGLYDKWRIRDGAKECCRVFLPEGLTMSNMAFKASVRTWLHYLDVRDDEGVTQWEHVQVARSIRSEIAPYFPAILGIK
jgi:thymidylate synthase (FAD)